MRVVYVEVEGRDDPERCAGVQGVDLVTQSEIHQLFAHVVTLDYA